MREAVQTPGSERSVPRKPARAEQTTSETFTIEVAEAIRLRAYALYELRGRTDGQAEEDWLRAEAEVLAALRSPAA